MKKIFLSAILTSAIACSLCLSVSAENNTELYVGQNTQSFPDGQVIILDHDDEFKELLAKKEASIFLSRNSFPLSRNINLTHYAQEETNYCGPAACQIILKSYGVSKEQSLLAGNNYLKTDNYGETPWYTIDGSSSEQFRMSYTLNALQSSFTYAPYPSGSLGTAPTKSDLQLRFMSTIGNNGRGVVAFGNSNKDKDHISHLPGYPTSYDVGHVITVEGYSGNGTSVDIVDPAGGTSCLGSDFANVQKKYSVSADKFTAFVATRGIFW